MQDGKKEFWLFCAVCLFLCASLAKLPAEQWFRISETELRTLETVSLNWETDKQDWLSQASVLRTIATELQADSKTLNLQLEAERMKVRSLRESFEKLETDRLQKYSEYETVIASLRDDKAKIALSASKVKGQRNTVFIAFVALLCGIVAYIAVKLKKLLF